MPVVEDQQTGGVIMKIIQEIVYGTVIGYVFFSDGRAANGRRRRMRRLHCRHTCKLSHEKNEIWFMLGSFPGFLL
ncbi:hypothetical protein GCM10020331_045130 [Ectobacillus funiculus]